MHSPEGIDYPTTGRFLEVDPPNRLVFTGEATDMPPDWQAALDAATPSTPPGTELRIGNTVTFEDRDGGTLLTITSAFLSNEERDAVVQLGAISGWSESFEKLDSLLAPPSPSARRWSAWELCRAGPRASRSSTAPSPRPDPWLDPPRPVG